MRLKASLRAVAAAGLVASALVLAPAAPAQASVGNCSGRYDLEFFNTWAVYCGQGTGEFRARARCYRIGRDTYVTRYGVWRRAGSTHSTVFCQSGEEVATGGWETRG